jgi:hypothetical protein
MRSSRFFLILIGASMWGAAFYYGPNSGAWALGKWGIFSIALAGILRVTEFLIPNRRPQPKHTKGPARKCPVCGKPATTGSSFCGYHARYGSEDDRR